jgi:hypothetical protein
MDSVLAVFSFIAANWQALLAGVSGLLSAAIVIALIIPGEQPEKFLQGVVDFLKKFSAK